MRQVIHVALILINNFSFHFNTKELSLFSDMMLLFLNGYHGNNKNITAVFQICQTIHPKNFMFVLALQTEIFDTGYC